MRTSIRVMEAITTWQAEGPDCGKRMALIRFKRCDRNCPFCDTQVKMRISQEFEFSIKEIQNMIDEGNNGLLITGGEPTFNLNLPSTIDIINSIKCTLVNVETNGCQLLKLIESVNKNKNVKYMLSPKLFSNNDLAFYIKLVDEIKDNPKVYIKLVTEDRKEIYSFLDYLSLISFDNNRIFLMPEGKTRDELLKHAPIVFDLAEKYKTNFSSRDHIIYDFI